jgi:hypothetical protein
MLARARQYVEEFDGNIASFIFSGKPGTGKTTAAAICNELLLRGKSVLIITVADIMSAMKDTFGNRETSEEQLLSDLSKVDLLVIDEIGMQTESRYEKVIINQIVDRRSSSNGLPDAHQQQYGRDEQAARRAGDGPYAAGQQPVGYLQLGKLPAPRQARSIKRFPDDDGVILKRLFSHAYESVYEIV